MELRQLSYFATIVKEERFWLHLSAGESDGLYISSSFSAVPAVSRHVISCHINKNKDASIVKEMRPCNYFLLCLFCFS